MDQRIAAFISGFILSAMVSVSVYHTYIIGKLEENDNLACQIGYRLAIIKYKSYEIDDIAKIKTDANLRCQDWVIKGFIERHAK